MTEALKGVPVSEYTPPAGVIHVGSEWYYEEYGPGRGVRGLGLRDPWPGATSRAPENAEASAEGDATGDDAAASEDRRSILDLFKN